MMGSEEELGLEEGSTSSQSRKVQNCHHGSSLGLSCPWKESAVLSKKGGQTWHTHGTVVVVGMVGAAKTGTTAATTRSAEMEVVERIV